MTRHELAAYMQGLFLENGLIDRDDLVRQLEANGAPAEAVHLIEDRIPEDARMANLRTIWQYLPDVPVS
ncbi:MAG TPA: hypothetical protein VM184_00690 [Gaiellaceae bacterium]|nr:hypothetical protein [Gaiellaceae bacterium]